ncbi:MAG: TIM barrel protein [Anaerolineaceae bacterium]|nr:TIM barrel protein [Anaerolineaceae bacterium]MCY3905780.1 TIM barrel protein [Anaerolineaceae bacterium]
MIRQSASWWCFVPHRMKAKNFVRTAADSGYAGIELVDEAHWPLIRDHGLEIVVIFGHDTLNDGLNKRSNRDRILRELEANLRLAEEWNIANLVVFSGQRNGLADDVGMQVCAETLAAIAPKAESAGVTLLLELLNSKVNHPDYQCDRTAWGVQVCRMVDSSAVRLLYDIYHMQVMEGDIIQTIRDNHAWFGHYHTAGVPGRNELNDDQELNYAAIVRAIVASGHDGYIGHEFIPLGDPAAALRQASALTAANL